MQPTTYPMQSGFANPAQFYGAASPNMMGYYGMGNYGGGYTYPVPYPVPYAVPKQPEPQAERRSGSLLSGMITGAVDGFALGGMYGYKPGGITALIGTPVFAIGGILVGALMGAMRGSDWTESIMDTVPSSAALAIGTTNPSTII